MLTLLAPHFEDRMPSEDWIITDKNRLLSAVHPKDRNYTLTPVTGQELEYIESIKTVLIPIPDCGKPFLIPLLFKNGRTQNARETSFPSGIERT